MNISLAALEAALSEIEKLGHDETTFEVGGTRITMRSLTPELEGEVQRYAAQAWTDDDDNDTGETLAFVDRFRLETIARALVAVGDVDMREVEYLETGEVLPNGKPVKEARHVVLRRLVQRWGGPIRFRVFKKYTAMLREIEKVAENAIEFEPSDTEAEISRLKDRIRELEQESKSEETSEYMNPAHAVSEYGDMDQKTREFALEKDRISNTPATPENPIPEESPNLSDEVVSPNWNEAPASPVRGSENMSPQVRQPIVPREASPPPHVSSVSPPVSGTPTSPYTASTSDSGIQTMDGSSFIGSDDIGSSVAEANRQLAAARAQNGGPSYPPAESALNAVHQSLRSLAPHQGAADVAAGIEAAEVQRQQMLRRAGVTPEGVEVYHMGESEEVDLGQKAAKRDPVPLTHAPNSGTANPRFNPRPR